MEDYDYAEGSGPEAVLLLCSFYHDPLQPQLLCLVSYKASIEE